MKKITHIKVFKDLVKSLKIHSCHIDDKLVDYKTIDDYTLNELDKLYEDNKIQVARKYLNELNKQDIDMDIIVKFNNTIGNIYFINQDGKFIDIKVSSHAVEQLFKRMLYIYIVQDKFEFNYDTNYIYKNHINDMIDLCRESLTSETDLSNNVLAHKIIKKLLNRASIFIPANAKRYRDKQSFIRRDKQQGDTVRYLVHPFLFVVQDNILKTVELYSNNIDTRHLNKFTNTDEYKEWFKEVFKVL